MRFLRRIAAFLLLAVWLTATQHCALEAAGLWGSSHEATADACCSGSEDHCAHDGCDLVEGGSFHAANPWVKVPVPDLQAGAWLLCLQSLATDATAEPVAEFVAGVERPLGWLPTRHFARRAAPSPRAPASIRA